MRVVIDYGLPSHKRHFQTLARDLRASGLEVVEVATYHHTKGYKFFTINNANHNEFTFLHGKYRNDQIGRLKYLISCVIDALHYSKSWAKNYKILKVRSLNMLVHALSECFSISVSNSAIENFMSSLSEEEKSELILILTKFISKTKPAEDNIRFVESLKSDIWIFTQIAFTQYSQSDYLSAASFLNIPTIYLPFSWDNFTTKGRLSVLPDHILTWNKQQINELLFHDINYSKVNVEAIGSFRFNTFPSFGLLRKNNNKIKSLNILYLGSSDLINDNEDRFIISWYSALRQSKYHLLKTANVIVRPHPRNASRIQKKLCQLGLDASVLMPDGISDTDSLNQLLSNADVVVASNTSAELEAALSGHVIFTVCSDYYNSDLKNTYHFNHLSDEKKGIKIISDDFEAHFYQIQNYIENPDIYNEKVKNFVSEFIFGSVVSKKAHDKLLDYIDKNILLKNYSTADVKNNNIFNIDNVINYFGRTLFDRYDSRLNKFFLRYLYLLYR
jgi:hypothetical protein